MGGGGGLVGKWHLRGYLRAKKGRVLKKDAS